jgi:hypothetical protein
MLFYYSLYYMFNFLKANFEYLSGNFEVFHLLNPHLTDFAQRDRHLSSPPGRNLKAFKSNDLKALLVRNILRRNVFS